MIIEREEIFEQLIYDVLEELNPGNGDDAMVEIMEDYDKRAEAIDYLIKQLESMREK